MDGRRENECHLGERKDNLRGINAKIEMEENLQLVKSQKGKSLQSR